MSKIQETFCSNSLSDIFKKKIVVLERCDSLKSGVDVINYQNPDLIFS